MKAALILMTAAILTGCGPQTPVICKATGEFGEVERKRYRFPTIWVKVEKMQCDNGTVTVREIE